MTTESLTYSELGERLGSSPEAARSLARRLRLVRTGETCGCNRRRLRSPAAGPRRRPVSTTARASEARSLSKQLARLSHKVMSSALALPCRLCRRVTPECGGRGSAPASHRDRCCEGVAKAQSSSP
jgi:hypothetical protein